ncbi:MAG: ABC transporter substrate-binding protein [Desulfobacterales bacterium]|jgi:branched-chain amino acid transport system substrate-binding protein
MKRQKWWVILMIAISVSMFFGNQAVAADKVLKIGIMGPFTGPSAKTGNEFKGSVTLALEKIDYMIGDYKIEPVWIDSQSDPAKATSAYAEAVESKGIQVGALNWHSSVAAAVMDVAAQYKIHHLFGMGAAEIVNEKWQSDPEKFSYWGGKGWPVPGKLMLGYVECLSDAVEKGIWKPKNKKVALYGEDTDWGRSVGQAFRKEFGKRGWEIVSEDYFPTTQTDFYPLLSKYKKNEVAVLAGTSTSAPSMSAFIKQAEEVQLKSMIVADGLGWIGDWYKMTGPSANYVLDMIPQLTTQAAQKWAKEVETKFGYTPSPSSSGLAYDGINFFIKIARRALEQHGKLDKESIHQTIVDEVYTGKLTFGAADGALIMNEYKYAADTLPDPVIARDAYYFPVIQYKEGKGAIVFPDDWKTKEFEPKQ